MKQTRMWMLSYVGTAVLSLINCGASYSQHLDNSNQAVGVHRVAGDVYMLDTDTTKFNGGNIAVLVGSDGLLLVDTGHESNSQAVARKLKEISEKPVRYVISTHCHADHIGGNATFQKAGATFIVHANVLKRIEQKKCDKVELGRPTITFDSTLTLRTDGEEVTVIKVPVGHTDGDSIVYFKKANVVHTGDTFVAINTPFHSKYAGGHLVDLADSLRKIVSLVPDDAKVIPGHGPQVTVSEIRRAIRTLDEVKSAMSLHVSNGKTIDELKKMNVLSPWKDSLGADELDYYLRNFYEELAGTPTSSGFQISE